MNEFNVIVMLCTLANRDVPQSVQHRDY